MSCLVPAFVSLLLAQPTQAEKIARLERSLQTNRQQLADLRKSLDEANAEYQKASTEFGEIDPPYQKKFQEEKQLRSQGKVVEADILSREAAGLRARWPRARERFELALQRRKALQEKANSLQRTIDQDQKEMDQLVGPSGSTGLIGQMINQVAKKQAAAEAKKEDRKKEDRQIASARDQAKQACEAAQEARKRAETLTERIDALKQSIEVEERLRETARKTAELARKTRRSLERDLAKVAEPDRATLHERIAAADQRHHEAGEEERQSGDRLAELQDELSSVQAEQMTALREADHKRKEAHDADKRLASLEGVFSLRGILRWLGVHGPQILLIIAGVLVLRRLVRRASRSIALFVIRSTHIGRTDEDRAETLSRVFRSTASLAIVIGGGLMILEQFGVPVGPLLGGAAVLGLAVAFGAQNLVKDYFTGFMVLLEDQYAVNDIIKVNNTHGGKVEKITLRMTVLRDSSGTAHFIPHGTISTVSNMSHGWSRVALDVAVDYKEDVDRVMDVIRELCVQLREDAVFAPLMLEEAEMLGVDQLADSAVIVKFLIKTKPQEQWKVKRELLRRIKHRFDELGIEIPFPHRTVYHRDIDPKSPMAA